MEELIKQIEKLMAAVKAQEPQTGYLQVAAGGLQSAKENCQYHLEATKRVAPLKPGAPAPFNRKD